MNRRNILIASTLVILIIIGGAAFWYFSQRATIPTDGGQFPGGSTDSTGGPQVETTPSGEGEVISTGALPRLYELHKAPVAGVGLVETKDKKGTVTSISTRYVERGLGHIFETGLSTYNETRIVNETRARISEALWGNNGNSVVFRSINDKNNDSIQTRVINIEIPGVSFANTSSGEALAEGFLKTEEVFLPENIPFMSTSGDNADSLFYLESGLNASVGTMASFKNTSVSKIFSSSFTEWLPQFPNKNLVTLTTKPSATVPGHLFFLDTKTKAVSKVLSAINGLTTLTSPNGKFILFSETKAGVPELSLYDVTLKKKYSLYVKTLPEKCAWGKKNALLIYCAVPQTIPTGTYPDQWYQGLVSFSDELWTIDTTAMTHTTTMVPSTYSAPSLDIINPTISSNDEYFLFINKTTNTPWVYSFAEHFPPTVTPPSPDDIAPATTTVPPSVITPDMQKLK